MTSEQNIQLNEKRPHVPKGTHPVETGSYCLPTNEILGLYDEISRWLLNRSPGGIIYGRPRLGKTRAIKFLRALLREEFGSNLPIYQMNCNHYKTANENRFFTDLLKDLGHNLYLSGKTEMKRDRAIKFLLERAESSSQHRIILFIDDAQRLGESQYDWLMDIYNELDRYNVYMTVILVGQDELTYQRTAFITARKMQIVGRFMIHEYKFSGIKSIDDLRTCLAGYDMASEYPKSSGWCFTKYYFPESFAQGRRLAECAEELYEQFNLLRTEAKILKPIEIPMQYITLTVEYCLRTYGADGKNVGFPCTADWSTSIRNSGFIEAELYYSLLNEVNK